MAKTVVELGTVVQNRGQYASNVKYYKDNIVQYQNSSYIVTSVPQAIGYLQNVVPTTPNSGWSIFAYGAADVIAKTPRVDVSQSFTDAEKKQVRANIGLGNGDIDAEPTAGSDNLVKSGGIQNELALGAVYDVSSKNPTAGPNNDGKWESLSALLSDANLSTLIPTSVRKGGMSIKFVQSSDNKYVQYFLTKDEWSANVGDWEKTNLEEEVNQLGGFIEDAEYIKAVTDSVGRVIEGVSVDGEKVINVPTTINADLLVTGKMINQELNDKVDDFIDSTTDKLSYIEDVASPEWLRVVTDKDGKIIEGITIDGKKVVAVDTEYPNGIPTVIKEYIDNNIPEPTPPTPTPQDLSISAESYNQLATDKCNDEQKYTFNMCDVEKGKVTLRYTITDYIAKIAIFGDLHVGLGYSEQVIWDNWENCIEQSLKWASDKYPYFGIAMGDQLSSMNSSIRNKGIRELLDYYNRIRPFNFPLFPISGNHDAAVPEFTHEGIIEIANVRIICFSANLDYSEQNDPIGNVTDATYTWLASEVAKSYNAGYITILACHYCLLKTSGTGDWRGYINNHRNDIITLCSTYNVRLFISAHNHRSGLLHGIVSTEGGVDLDMTNVQFGMGGRVYSELIITNEGFNFTEHEVSVFDHTEGDVQYYKKSDDHITHTLYVPLNGQAQGTIYE